MTVSPRERLPTVRGRQTHAAIDAAARAVVARKGFLATTIVDIAAEAGKSAASFYNDYDSKESMVRESHGERRRSGIDCPSPGFNAQPVLLLPINR